MTIKNRIAKAEKAKRAAEPVEFQVWLIQEDGYCERHDPNGKLIERITKAELDARHKPGDKVYEISPETIGENYA